MSTIKVDTIATRTGSGNITLSNNVASLTSAGAISGTNLSASGTLAVTGLITASAGVAIGGTGSANTLDDYEEGTFDPFTNVADQFTGEVIRTATYRKIGTMVAIDLRVNFTGTDNSSSNFVLALPFTSAVASNNATAYTGAIMYEGTQLFSGASIISHNASGTNTVIPYRGDGGTFTSVTRANVNGTYDFLINFVYFSA